MKTCAKTETRFLFLLNLQYIYKDTDFNKPFFLTYFNTALFSIYLVGFLSPKTFGFKKTARNSGIECSILCYIPFKFQNLILFIPIRKKVDSTKVFVFRMVKIFGGFGGGQKWTFEQ